MLPIPYSRHSSNLPSAIHHNPPKTTSACRSTKSLVPLSTGSSVLANGPTLPVEEIVVRKRIVFISNAFLPLRSLAAYMVMMSLDVSAISLFCHNPTTTHLSHNFAVRQHYQTKSNNHSHKEATATRKSPYCSRT